MDNPTKELQIKALDKTIDQYQRAMNNNVSYIQIRNRDQIYSKRQFACHLCIVANINCENCIHTSEFGSGQMCIWQKSYDPNTTDKRLIAYRHSYLIKIRDKLIKSLQDG